MKLPTVRFRKAKTWRWLPWWEVSWGDGKYGERAVWFSWLGFRSWAYLTVMLIILLLVSPPCYAQQPQDALEVWDGQVTETNDEFVKFRISNGFNKDVEQWWSLKDGLQADWAKLYLNGQPIRMGDLPKAPYRVSTTWKFHDGVWTLLEVRVKTR